VQIPADIPIDALETALALDKKAVASGLRLVLLEALGQARVDADSTEAEILDAMLNNQRCSTKQARKVKG